jgi:hypothetical protein
MGEDRAVRTLGIGGSRNVRRSAWSPRRTLTDTSRHAVLDEEKLETLCRWGEGLTRDGREEVAAAGRAILMLVEEIERLHVDLWNATQLFRQAQPSNTSEQAERAEPTSAAHALSERLKQGARQTEDSRSD